MEATVLIPTHDHADTLLYSIASARGQTVSAIEIFVAGDGVPDRTRELMAGIAAEDARVRFFDFAKGPRHGELNRHEALQQARGRCVCYLCDDDLWLPTHLERLCEALERADLAHAVEVVVPPDGEPPMVNGFDYGHPADRRLVLESDSGYGLSGGGHTLDAYRRLPHGWRTTPSGLRTDVYMWRQFLERSWCRAVSVPSISVLKFASLLRQNWTLEQRVRELAEWAPRVAERAFGERLAGDAIRALWRRTTDPRHSTQWIRLPAGEAFPPCAIGQRLDFAKGGNATRYLSWGWAEGEAWGRWSDGAEARVTLTLDRTATGRDLEIEIDVQGFVAPRAPWLDVDVTLNGERVAAWAFVDRTEIKRQIVKAPARLIEHELVDLRFHMPAPAPPDSSGLPPDTRRLGVGVASMQLRVAQALLPAGPGTPAEPSETSPQPRHE